MDYFLINLRPNENPDYCFLDDYPEGLGLKTWKLHKGVEIGADYPKGARVYMSDDEPGIQLPDLIGNTCSMLLVSRKFQESIRQVNQGPTEYLPVAIYNHKKRLASADYFIINPLGTYDCLDVEKSDIDYHEGQIVAVNEHVLDPRKLSSVPDLFRIREEPGAYVVSERLLEVWLDMDPRPSNVLLIDLEQSRP